MRDEAAGGWMRRSFTSANLRFELLGNGIKNKFLFKFLNTIVAIF